MLTNYRGFVFAIILILGLAGGVVAAPGDLDAAFADW